MQLDARDLAILQTLSREGRITQAALAEKVGLSPTPCCERLNRLEKAGILAGYHAEIALKSLGPPVTVFVTAELADHTAASFRKAGARLGMEAFTEAKYLCRDDG